MSQHPPPPPSAQQPPQYAQRPWSPQQGLNSPHLGDYPPSKRPRLSPNPHSPYGSPGLANISLPNQLFSRPFQGPHQNGYPSNPSNYHNTLNQAPPPPPPTHAMGTMGPPSRPSDKPTDMNELTDVLLGAGVDLREEDAALVRRNNAQHHDTSFNPHLTNSFNSMGSGSPPNLSLPPKIDYNHYSNNFPGEKSSFYGSGTFNQPAVPYQSPEERATKEREQAERRKAETRQYHLNNPFLYTGPLQRRVEKQAKMNHLHTNLPGHYKPSAGNQPTQVAVSGPDKHERIEVLTGQHLITYDSPWVEILTLLSLAAGQRIRGFVEDAAALAKTRRIGSQGIVPPDLQDLAVGIGKAETVPNLPTASNSAVSPKTNPLKRSYAEINTPPTPVSNGQQSPVTTIAFPNKIVAALQKSALAQRAAEEDRLAKRRRRAAAAAASGDSSTAGSVAPDPSATGAGQRAPEPDPKKTGSKKEQRKKDEAKATEAQQHAATNKTMNMAFGLSGAMGGKKLSWMTGGASSGSSSFSRANATTANTKTPLKTTGLSGSSLPAGRKWGDFREDKETGAGVQLRDLVSVLEDDGKEKRALARAPGLSSHKDLVFEMPICTIDILQPPGPTVFQSCRAPPFDAESNPSVPPTFLAALGVRFPVFVDEQKCSAAEEIDKDDPISWHWVVYVKESGEEPDKVAAGTIRLVPVQPLLKHGELNDKSEEKKEEEVKQALGPKHERTEMWDGQEAFVKLGRMATLKGYRKFGLGRLLVDTAVEWLEQNHEKVAREMEVDGAAKDTDEAIENWHGLVLVHAQKEIERFWGSCGFVRDDGMGEWWEEGIVHIAMWRRVTVK